MKDPNVILLVKMLIGCAGIFLLACAVLAIQWLISKRKWVVKHHETIIKLVVLAMVVATIVFVVRERRQERVNRVLSSSVQ